MFDLKPLLEGFAFGIALIFAPGPQSAHLIKQGLARDFAFATAITAFASDCLFVGVLGMSLSGAMRMSAEGVMLASWLGVAFVGCCGLHSLFGPVPLSPQDLGPTPGGRSQAMRKILALTWLNPLFYIEVSTLCGLASSYGEVVAQWQFLSAYLASSLVRYLTLSLAARPFSQWFRKPGAPKVFDRVSGLIMLAVAISLGATLAGGQ